MSAATVNDYLPHRDPDAGSWRMAVRTALARIEPLGTVRGLLEGAEFDARALVRFEQELGLLALLVPEELGGSGASMAETVIAVEELGRVLYPGPYLDSMLALRVLAQLSEGDSLPPGAEAAHAGLSVDTAEGITASGSAGWRLSGSRELASGFDDGDRLIVVRAAAPEDALFLVRSGDAGCRIEIYPTVDPSSPASELRLDDCPATLLARGAAVGPLLAELTAFGAVLVAADAVGGAAACLDRAVQYAKEREQFGQPIGQFQAIKHQCAEMLVLVEGARLAVQAAAGVLDAGQPAAEAVSVAKATACEAYQECAMMSLHIFGGRGFLWSDDAHLYLRRALKDSVRYGSPAAHRDTLAHLLRRSGEEVAA